MGLEEFRADVQAADESGPLCDHWTTPLHHVSIRFLAELDLVKPVKTRIPACSAHGCILLEKCAHREMFETGTGTRGSIKATLTAAGRAAFADTAALTRALGGHRLMAAVRAALAERPHSVFELHARLLRACTHEMEQTGAMDETGFSRTDLLGCLELMEALGELAWDRQTGRIAATVESVG